MAGGMPSCLQIKQKLLAGKRENQYNGYGNKKFVCLLFNKFYDNTPKAYVCMEIEKYLMKTE